MNRSLGISDSTGIRDKYKPGKALFCLVLYLSLLGRSESIWAEWFKGPDDSLEEGLLCQYRGIPYSPHLESIHHTTVFLSHLGENQMLFAWYYSRQKINKQTWHTEGSLKFTIFFSPVSVNPTWSRDRTAIFPLLTFRNWGNHTRSRSAVGKEYTVCYKLQNPVQVLRK